MLEIKFRTGRVYRYRPVPRVVYEELSAASSAGKYFNDLIRTSYDGELVYDPSRPRLRS
jgi:KTSC domain